ncbi:P-loop NTPase [Algimonas porphyrae]|uniref:Iron-sulfur cluster carrier protein n=1 Tax=Algimonas porphyrae TaxID=1128113 RepID=A0ABQ5V3C0_9PROT|nr:Mrp/NBP35 family ATP-binding protein [Algimonas porphyrae]GLQ22020.1 iron-sulfur cluster carrier protein [Algimonas porphyrae]
MSDYSEDAVLSALSGVKDALSERDLVSAGRLSDLSFDDGRLRIILGLPPETTQDQGLQLRNAAEAALTDLPGITQLAVLLTTHKAAPALKTTAPKRPDRNPHPNKRPEGYQGDAQVAKTLAVSSAKGGVGKSTVTAGLARALAAAGLRIGVLDADIHGPSIPSLFGLSGRLDSRMVQNRRLIGPAEVDGVKIVSIGLLTGSEDPVVWRGPMVQGAIARMLWDTDWGALDLLLIDMPPGTGDPQLGLAQDIQPDGAVIVTTPQDLALMDARKGVGMFEKVDIPVSGWIENMASFTCPDCGSEHRLFGEGVLELPAERAIPKLGSLPLSLEMRDARTGYDALAQALLGRLS